MKTLLRTSALFIIVLLYSSVSFSQKKQIEKANEDFDQYGYIDAQKVYLKVVEDGYHSSEIYKKLGDTYYYNGNYIEAAKWYNELLKTYPDEVETDYYYRTALTLKSMDKHTESDKLMVKYVESGGVMPAVQVFENDPEYLKSLGIQSSRYVVEEVATNSEYSDFGPTYYKDKLVFSTTSRDLDNFKKNNWNNLPYLDLYIADMDEDGNLSNVKPLGGDINTKYHESSPIFSKDGNTIYFTRNNFSKGRTFSDKKRTIRLKIFKATKNEDDKWGDVEELPFNNKNYSVSHPALNNDETRIYFASDMPGTYGKSDLWYVDILEDNKYGDPVNMGESINTRARETFPFISENNNLYYSSDGRGGNGGLDVYIAPLDENGEVEVISNFGEPINTNQDDFGFIIEESKGIGFFTSNKDGGRGSIDDDIYRFKEVCIITINGNVTDMDTGKLLPGAEVSYLDKDNKLIQKIIVGSDASYSFSANCDSNYIIRGTKKEYFPNEKMVETPDVGGVIETSLQLKIKDPCPPNDLGCRLNLLPIYFDFDKSDIRKDAEIELAKILAALREYPQLVIHIESHTDSRGRDSYNESLSERRAQSTLSWFVDQGIDSNRLSAKGYGENQLVNQCTNEVECSEKEHQLNRRSMFIIQD